MMLVLTFLALLGFGTRNATAAAVSPEALGVNSEYGPNDLSLASSNGLGVIRTQINQGWNADAFFTWAAAAHLRLAPLLGLSQQLSPSAAATAMAQYITAFAQRYGPNGSFWAQNPQLPYLPAEDFEIGNEPNLPLQWVVDNTGVHWPDPSAYAQVYEAARTALHQVDPSGRAVVGGLADSASLGVDVQHDEEWLAALAPGQVDAVGYHPYTEDVSIGLVRSDTETLRQWMDSHGMQSVPIEVNEIGWCDRQPQDTILNLGCVPSISSEDLGPFVAGYTTWALCTPTLGVRSVLPEYWGDLATTDVNMVLPFVTSEGSLTPYGQDFLATAHSLTTLGCPPESTSPPTIAGSPVSGQLLAATPGAWTVAAPTFAYHWERCNANGQSCTNIPGAISPRYQVEPGDVGSRLAVSVTASNIAGGTAAASAPTNVVTSPPTSDPPSGGSHGLPAMALRVSGMRVHGRYVTLTVHLSPSSPHVSVIAFRRRHRIRLRLIRHNRRHTALTFIGRLARGRWILTVTCQAAVAHAAAAPLRLAVRIH
jgi:hypothetical protein